MGFFEGVCKNPHIERSIRTIKYEKLYIDKPATEEDIIACGEEFLAFYNYERAHQGFTCQNQPPMVAHSDLPALNALPQRVNPDRWVDEYHMEVFKRHIASSGAIQVDNHVYHIGKEYALQTATLYLNALHQTFQINVGSVQLPSQPIKGLHYRIMDFDEYAEIMIKEAQAVARQQR